MFSIIRRSTFAVILSFVARKSGCEGRIDRGSPRHLCDWHRVGRALAVFRSVQVDRPAGSRSREPRRSKGVLVLSSPPQSSIKQTRRRTIGGLKCRSASLAGRSCPCNRSNPPRGPQPARAQQNGHQAGARVRRRVDPARPASVLTASSRPPRPGCAGTHPLADGGWPARTPPSVSRSSSMRLGVCSGGSEAGHAVQRRARRVCRQVCRAGQVNANRGRAARRSSSGPDGGRAGIRW